MTPLHPGDVVRLVHGSAERWAPVLRVTERGQVLVAHQARWWPAAQKWEASPHLGMRGREVWAPTLRAALRAQRRTHG